MATFNQSRTNITQAYHDQRIRYYTGTIATPVGVLG
jgi:hypothetical protein